LKFLHQFRVLNEEGRPAKHSIVIILAVQREAGERDERRWRQRAQPIGIGS
jgi:hypothetical protein